jgi:type VI secretion system secreted protein Hcp
MTSDCFLKLKGINGEAADPEHVDEIQVTAWDWAVAAADGLPGDRSRGDTRRLLVTHRVDAATPALLVSCVRGTVIPSAVLTLRKATGGPPLPYFTAKMDRVRVATVTTALRPNGDTEEVVALAFERVEVTYIPQIGTGGGSGAMTQQWDVREGRA